MHAQLFVTSRSTYEVFAALPLPGTPMQCMPPGSVGKTTRAIFEQLSKRGQEWGEWEKQEEIAQVITEFRREQRSNILP
jgi:hypothetical protein